MKKRLVSERRRGRGVRTELFFLLFFLLLLGSCSTTREQLENMVHHFSKDFQIGIKNIHHDFQREARTTREDFTDTGRIFSSAPGIVISEFDISGLTDSGGLLLSSEKGRLDSLEESLRLILSLAPGIYR